MYKRILIFCILVMIIIPFASAIPTTVSATNVFSNNVTLTMSGAATPAWFLWGVNNQSLSWDTPNQTPTGGNLVYKIEGSPLIGNGLFYYKACDDTGCGVVKSFTTLPLVPQPQTTFGYLYDNITVNKFKLNIIGYEVIQPYFWKLPGDTGVLVWTLLFIAIYFGLWLRNRDITIPVIVGLITGSFIMFSDVGLHLGIPLVFVGLAQGILYAALAGIIFMIFKR